MRRTLMLEALAAWLALAAVSGQDCASIQTGATSGLTMVANPMVIDRRTSLDEITTPYSDGKVPANGSIRAKTDVALLTSGAVARKGTPARPTNGLHTPARELKQRVAFNRHEVVRAPQPQAVLVAASGRSELDAEKFYLVGNAQPAPGPTDPQPRHLGTVFAGAAW